ncbi:MAG: lytic transglycosylase domain-containing protein [Candidatus Melainabacteria bacterium]|jgi:soluble lytic murein transglycosylase-like protein
MTKTIQQDSIRQFNNKSFKKLLSLVLFSSLTAIHLASFIVIPSQADTVEVLIGDEMINVDPNNSSIDLIPDNIAPQGFNSLIQSNAYAPSGEVSKAFKAIRAKSAALTASKNNNSNPFVFDPLFSQGASALGVSVSESLRRPQVIVSINQISGKGNQRLSIAKQRLQYYQRMWEQIFVEEGVPPELISIGFVESTFNPSAISRSGARGVWQFIPSTGRAFGLNSSEDFSDPVKSTRAAAKYLKILHKRFGDWLLVIAAYNAGDTRVQQAINMSNGNKDFWEVSRYLPNETKNYVPRVLAATVVMSGKGNNADSSEI